MLVQQEGTAVSVSGVSWSYSTYLALLVELSNTGNTTMKHLGSERAAASCWASIGQKHNDHKNQSEQSCTDQQQAD